MDKKAGKLLSRYRYCIAFWNMGNGFGKCRESIRSQGRSLQCLHESSIEYAKTLPEEERREALNLLRRRYNLLVRLLKRDKKEVKESTRIVSKYQGKRLLINSGSGGKDYDVLVRYRYGSNVWVRYPDGRETSLSPRLFRHVKRVEE